MYITMGTAVYGYICYEFLGLFEAVQRVPWDMVRVHEYTRGTPNVDC